VLTTTSSSTRRALEKQLDQAIGRQTEINSKVDDLNQQLFEYETEIVEVTSNANITGELGPLKYLSGLTGKPMDKIINWLLLTIIFVFDPLAIALVIAANFAFEQLKLKTRKNVYGETVSREKVFEVLNMTQEEISRELDKNDKEPEVKVVEKIVEVPVEVEKIVEVPVEVEKIVEKELPTDPIIAEALKHARRARRK
jgi:hypothetical protein